MRPRGLLEESACDAKLRPSSREVCKLKECYLDAKWRKGDWGKVMLPCMMLDRILCLSLTSVQGFQCHTFEHHPQGGSF